MRKHVRQGKLCNEHMLGSVGFLEPGASLAFKLDIKQQFVIGFDFLTFDDHRHCESVKKGHLTSTKLPCMQEMKISCTKPQRDL